jgi:hypothetical protein
METQLTTRHPATLAYSTPRARVVSLLGPLAVAAGIGWAILQPYRLTLLHPHHQGFWWLVIEPPLLVVAAGAFFALAIARPLIADLEEARGTP